MIFPSMSPPFSCLRLSNSFLPSSITFLHRGSPCEPTHAMLLVAWPSARHKFPSPVHIHDSPKSSAQHLQIILHHRRLHLPAHPAVVSLTRCSSRRCARHSTLTIRRAPHRAPSGHSARLPLSSCCSAPRWSQARSLPMLSRDSSHSPYATRSRLSAGSHA